MIDSQALVKDLKGQLKNLQDDLRQRANDPENGWGRRLRSEHERALRTERTARSWVEWRDDEVDQAAVAWLVATTFVRFCEDNDLLVGARLDGAAVPVGWIGGPGDRTQRAEENLGAYVREHPLHSRRHWLQHAFRVLAAQPAGAALVDERHNPVWSAEISPEAATDLITFWRRTDNDGRLVHDFTDPDLGTRFLGDLYQDLSEYAKKTYALLQTPVFVEEFILDRTLTPALRETPLEELKVIDPTCGSGHFLLGAFDQIHAAWREHAPALDPKERVRRAMDAIHGVDLNPFAVAIARFRLTVAALLAAGERSLVGVPAPGFHLAIGDSLLGEQGGDTKLDDTLDLGDGGFEKRTQDLSEYADILQPGRYHVVVGNPPYITVKDKALNQLYRKSYSTTAGKYALSVPFMELFFRLAVKGGQGVPAGHVGQITSNSFMKREFGRRVIEDLFAGYHQDNPVDLTEVIDTSGAYIPGHGTPTVVLVGRRRRPTGDTVRAVLGVRGEPGQPENAAKGLVWTEIVGHLSEPGYDGTYVSVADLDRDVLRQFPWSLSGGGAGGLKAQLDGAAWQPLSTVASHLGITSVTGEDSLYMLGCEGAHGRLRVEATRPLVEGEFVRDFGIGAEVEQAIWPYNDEFGVQPLSDLPTGMRRLFISYRSAINRRRRFGTPMVDRGLTWWEWQELYVEKLRTPLSITFAFVATHNHFVLDRGGKVFNRSAPVIKLPEGATEEQHLELLGVLNSSTACFWLKQVCHFKGVGGVNQESRTEQWEGFWEFTGTKLQEFPLPERLPVERARTLDELAQKLAEAAPGATIDRWIDRGEGNLGDALDAAERESARLRQRMIFEQEELDWEVYRLYGLIDDDLTSDNTDVDAVVLGERAFEIALARRIGVEGEATAWFRRHRTDPIAEVPESWPAAYRDLVQRRLDLMDADRSIRLLERPEFKRRWASTPWAKQRDEALTAAILDRLELSELWRDEQGPATRTVAELADLLRDDVVLVELVQALTGQTAPELATVLTKLVADQAVPYLAAHRYKPSGLEKFREWQRVWDLQRREDAGERVQIPVPPKYTTADFRTTSVWQARGKLDVPKERFIAYPDARHEGDATPVLGWAGWSHRDQALALAREIIVQESIGSAEAMVPLVAGLVELEPWVHQWHSELEEDFGTSAAAVVTGQIDQHLATLEMTRDQVTAWTPPPARRGRRPKSQ